MVFFTPAGLFTIVCIFLPYCLVCGDSFNFHLPPNPSQKSPPPPALQKLFSDFDHFDGGGGAFGHAEAGQLPRWLIPLSHQL